MAEKTKRLCSNCGAEISARAKICPNCGAELKTKRGHVPITWIKKE
ncbi:MAG: zinc-ribbon domain-containing protein [Candidatus Bathyarchaeota archaeon]|nr:zinc-ribbon domain-containing protein [Candidatus Bathyarchaeota archaeon]